MSNTSTALLGLASIRRSGGVRIAIGFIAGVALLGCGSGGPDATSATGPTSAGAAPSAPVSDAVQSCGAHSIAVQVLGSGGPEITYNERASSGYLVWIDGAARILIDAGSGTAANFGRAGAQLEDLFAIGLSHLHVDHSADLPALVKASFFSQRTDDLPLFGPTGNRVMPAMRDYVQALFGETGAFRYLSGFANPEARARYHLLPQDVEANGRAEFVALHRDLAELGGSTTGALTLRAIPVTHGPLPALAWRVDVGEHSVTFSGDMSGARGSLPELAKGTDLLIAHNAIPQSASGGVTALHMQPSTIGEIAAQAQPGRLVLSHRMLRTLGAESETQAAIAEHFTGEVSFADDMDCLVLAP